MKKLFFSLIAYLSMVGIVFSAQLVIDTVGTYNTPQKMMQAIDDNFDELYTWMATIDTEAELKSLYNLEIGTDVQAYDADLDYLSGFTPSANVKSILNAADYAAIKGLISVDDLITLSGVADGAVNLGAFTGSTITDNVTIKAALQLLETAIEGVAGGHDAATVSVALDTILSLTGQEFGLDVQNANYVFAGPTSGAAAAPTFRALVDDDIPNTITIDTATVGTNVTATANNSTNETVYIGFMDGATGSQGVETDTDFYYNPSTNVLNVGGIEVAASASPYMELKDSDAPGTDKESFKIYSQYVDGADGAENHDATFALKQGGTYVDWLILDESDDRFEFQKPISGIVQLVASGFDGNLATTDDTLQEVAQKVDDLIISDTEPVAWTIYDSDVVTAVADGKKAFVVPASMNGMNLIDVTASVADLNSASGGTTTVVIRRVRGATAVDMTSTGVTIDYNAYTASDETVDTSNDDIATGDMLYVDVNAVTTGAAQKGLSVTALFRLP